MKIFIITQEDSLVIPRNMQLLANANFIDIAGACIVESKNSLSEKKSLFIKNFGFFQVAKMGFILTKNKIINGFDLLFGSKLLKNKKSVKSFCNYNNLLFCKVKNVNNNEFISKLKHLDLDLIVSFSAPSIFKSELLSLPKKGCINLHCSLLPKYSGILPSFWTLFNDEKETGATIHFMDDEIDNGDILGQKSVEILKADSMFDIIKRTKKTGGNLMVDVIYNIMTNNIKLIKNKVNHKKYNSWPTDLDFKNFAKKRNLI
ncbi:formyltransferase family protein [Flavobacteriaceae bacterium]|nr:formyltransferase family protein [Flavobacteriaceae bacterium]